MINEHTIDKTLKFIINLKEGQEHILNKLTAKQTFGVREYIKLIEQIEDSIDLQKHDVVRYLELLTIPTRNNPIVEIDFIEKTKLNASTLKSCLRTAIASYRTYKTWIRKWEDRRDKASEKVITKFLTNIKIDESGDLEQPDIEGSISDFSNTNVWRKLHRAKPNKPLQGRKHKDKKIPIFQKFNALLLPYRENNQKFPYKIADNKLTIKIATLRKGERIELELTQSEYHLSQLKNARLTGGRIYKNNKKSRWEFHAKLIKEVCSITKEKEIIFGIDLGINTDVTLVGITDQTRLKQKNISFLKEGDLRKRKYQLTQRKKTLQKLTYTATGNERKKIIQELQNIGTKVFRLTMEICHRISRKVAIIAQNYIEEGYTVHIAIGKIAGLKERARRGNGKGSTYRGIIGSFPFAKLTDYISYKCQEVGVNKKHIKILSEAWTSKTCHRCESRNSTRKSANFKCLDCGLQYNADVNGAINIAKRYWAMVACSNCNSLSTETFEMGKIFCSECNTHLIYKENRRKNSEQVTMIFFHKKSEVVSKLQKPLLTTHGTYDSPTRNESAGTNVHSKVEETRKRS